MPDENDELALAGQQLETAGPEARVEDPAYIDEDGNIILPFRGQEFKGRKSVNFMAQAQFSKYTTLSLQDPHALPALYDLLRGSIVAADWGRFVDLCVSDESEDQTKLCEDLLDVSNRHIEVLAGRPTKPRGGSSATSRGSSPESTGKSTSQRAKGSARK